MVIALKEMKINACDVLHCIFQIVAGRNYRLELNLNTVSHLFLMCFHEPHHKIVLKQAYPRVCKTFVMLDFLEHKIYHSHIYSSK